VEILEKSQEGATNWPKTICLHLVLVWLVNIYSFVLYVLYIFVIFFFVSSDGRSAARHLHFNSLRGDVLRGKVPETLHPKVELHQKIFVYPTAAGLSACFSFLTASIFFGGWQNICVHVCIVA